MEWWLWIIAGIGLLSLEMFAPTGFFLFVIGFGGLVTGALVALGLLPEPWAQWAVCGALSIVLMFTLRGRLARALGRHWKETGSDIVSKEVVASEAIAPGAMGKGELGGTLWTIKNDGTTSLHAGGRYKVERMEGITLYVRHQ